MDERQRGAAVLTVDEEIRIQRQDSMALIELRHSDYASIGQRHRNVTVFPKQVAQCANMLVDPKCDAERPTVDEVQDGFLRIGITRQQVHRLRKHWLANEKRRVEFL